MAKFFQMKCHSSNAKIGKFLRNCKRTFWSSGSLEFTVAEGPHPSYCKMLLFYHYLSILLPNLEFSDFTLQ